MWQHLREKGIGLPKITAEEIDKKVIPVLREMETTGILLDVKILNNLAKKIEKKLSALEKSIYKLAGGEFNINSPIQMADILYNKLKLPTKEIKKLKNGFSTAAGELRKLEKEHDIIKFVLEYRELSKLLSTYLKPLPAMVDEKGRLHTHYGQDTSTGRMTSMEPNLQNIPIKGEYGGEIRKALVADPGMKLIAADYSQIELRVVACLAGDTAMLDAFKSGVDIHTRTAAEIFNTELSKVTKEQRRRAKTINFGVLYGMSPYGLSQALEISQEEAALYIQKYFSVHPGIKDYCNNTIDYAEKHGYVETLFGYRRNLPNINSPYRGPREAEERMAINTPVQGTAAEVLKLAMIELDNRIQIIEYSQRPQMLLTIHDEIVMQVPKAAADEAAKLIKQIMEEAISLCVPMEVEVEVGDNFGEMKKI